MDLINAAFQQIGSTAATQWPPSNPVQIFVACVVGYNVAWACFRLFIRPFCRDNNRMRGKVVVVTGCGTGFGQHIALQCHSMGAIVFAACRRQVSVDELNEQCNKNGETRMKALVADVTKDDDVARLLKAVEDLKVPVAAVVNNAGISAFGWTEGLPLERFKQNTEVNFYGTVRVTQAFIPLIRASRGRIVMMGSIGSCTPSAFGAAYMTTKAAMHTFGVCVRQELFRFGVRVCYIQPGFFETELLANGSANGAKDTSEDILAKAGYPSYAEKMEKSADTIRVIEGINGGKHGKEKVTDATVDAIINRFPLSHYTVGYDAFVLRHFLSKLPDWVIDWLQTYVI